MLLSPARIHTDLSAITSSTDTSYPHSALLITPAGQIMSWVSTPPGYDYYDEQDPNTNGNGGEDGEGDDDEPWLDTPERLRLILGLVAEFTEGSVSKVESEVRHFTRSKWKELMLARKAACITNMAGWTRGKCCCYYTCCSTTRVIQLSPGVKRNRKI